MDYGQPAKQDNTQPFFTSGAGTNLEETNNFESENNLDLDNHQVVWDVSPDRNPREIGNTAISNSETTSGAANDFPKNQEDINPLPMPGESEKIPELGSIISLEMSPKSEESQNGKRVTNFSSPNLEINKGETEEIKTTDKLNLSGIKAVDDAMNKLSQDGNIADFYNTIRGEGGMVIKNLENSYGENAAWKDAA